MEELGLIEIIAVSVNSCTEYTGNNSGKYVYNQNVCNNKQSVSQTGNEAYYTGLLVEI